VPERQSFEEEVQEEQEGDKAAPSKGDGQSTVQQATALS
jgi:hypothetical protein